MTQTVTSCGECPYILVNRPVGYNWCDHDDAKGDIRIIKFDKIHFHCPIRKQFPDMDGFEIIIKPIKK